MPTREELAKAVTQAYKAYEAAYKPDDFSKEYYEELGKKHATYDKAVRKLRRADKVEAAKHPVKFITWKRYGFRHIIASELPPEAHKYGNEKYTITRGMSFCGNDWYEHTPDPNSKEIWWLSTRFDQRGTDRPLCGTCRNHWKRLTGDDLT